MRLCAGILASLVRGGYARIIVDYCGFGTAGASTVTKPSLAPVPGSTGSNPVLTPHRPMRSNPPIRARFIRPRRKPSWQGARLPGALPVRRWPELLDCDRVGEGRVRSAHDDA